MGTPVIDLLYYTEKLRIFWITSNFSVGEQGVAGYVERVVNQGVG